MASVWTRVSRSCTNTQIRVIIGLTVLTFIYLLYRRHSSISPAGSKQTKPGVNKDASLDEQSLNGEIYLPEQQDHARKKHDGFDDEEDYDEKEHKNDAAQDDLYQFHSDMLNLDMQEVPAYMLQEEKCPACYGDNLCTDIKSGMLKINIPESATKESTKGVYFGRSFSSGSFMVLKQLAHDEEYQKFDSYICQATGNGEGCDTGNAIADSNSPVMQTEAFLPENLHKTRKMTASPGSVLSYAYCATKNLISAFSEAYDSDADGKLNAKDIASFYFSSVINPEPVILQFLSSLKVPVPVPHYWGACGRVIIEEAVGKTLDKFLDSEWTVRADFALQMLDLLDVFINGDPDWGVIFSDIRFENFAVNEDGQLYVIDVEGMAVIEKAEQVKADPHSPCNWECLQSFGRSMMQPDNKQLCSQALQMGSQGMYFFACQLLSDKVSHKVVYNGKVNNLQKADQGLLHSPPSANSEDLVSLLDECVSETSVGGRLQAVEELKDLLEDWVYEEEGEEGREEERYAGEEGEEEEDNVRYEEDEEDGRNLK